MEPVAVILILVLVAALAWALLQLRRRDGAGAIGGPRPPKVHRRRVAASNDPMAAVVAEHSQAVEPHEAAVAEARLQAQAKRVAAARQAGLADGPAPQGAEDATSGRLPHE